MLANILTSYAITLSGSHNTYSEWHVWWRDTPRKYRMIRITKVQSEAGQPPAHAISHTDGKWDPQYVWQPPSKLTLPCLVGQLREYFSEQTELAQDVMNLRIEFDKESEESKLIYNDDTPYIPDGPNISTLNRSAQYLMKLKTWGGCKIFQEREVVTQEIISGFRAKVKVGGRTCVEKKFPLAPFHLEPWVYDMKALHRLSGCVGIIDFIGVEVDATGQQLQGFLRGIEYCGLTTTLAEAADENNPISWARRETWAGQLINGLYEAHRNDFVVGTLDVNDIGLDEEDNANIMQISQGLGTTKCGCLAPELRDRLERLKPDEKLNAKKIDACQDIFAFGLILWLIAQVELPKGITKDPRMLGRIPWWKRLFCQQFECRYGQNELSDSPCQEQHLDPVDLPPCASMVPAYYREMITRCRSTYPQHRATARELKRLFKRGTARSV